MSVVIIGAGIAGLNVGESLRELGYKESITLVSDEPIAPYDRPPLSKQVLVGEALGDAPLRDQNWFADRDINLVLDDGAIGIEGQAVRLASGRELPFDRLVLATGARARRLPLVDEAGIDAFYLRTAADAATLKAAIRPACRLAVIGGGVIGLEVAATAASLGADVTVIEAGDRLMSRALTPLASSFVADYHRTKGVRVLLGETIVAVSTRPDGGAVLSSQNAGAVIADVVLVGIGAEPNVELAAAAGLKIDNGIIVDAEGRTSRADIFAVGDVVNFPCGFHGRMIRLEQWQSAIEQAITAAHAIMGHPLRVSAVPWFWSDQGELSLQVVGRTDGDEEVERTERDGRVLLHFDKRRLVGATMLNAAHLRRPLTKLVSTPSIVGFELLSDPAMDLRSLAKQAE